MSGSCNIPGSNSNHTLPYFLAFPWLCAFLHKTLPTIFSVPKGPGAPSGPAGGLTRAPDGTGLQAAPRERQGTRDSGGLLKIEVLFAMGVVIKLKFFTE